jgi:hypothetical protein
VERQGLAGHFGAADALVESGALGTVVVEF